MEFKKYQHVCRLGTQDTEGILEGQVFIFPKIDGTNGSVWLDDEGNVRAGSRNRTLELGSKDNQGFYRHIIQDENIKGYLQKHPTHRLFMEFLVPHSLRTYEETAWRNYYIFDVCEDNGDDFRYLPYKEYVPLLQEFNLNFIPLLAAIENPTVEFIKDCVKANKWLIKPDHGVGEGVVIKNYNYKNKYGRVVWAKVIHDEFDNGTKTKAAVGLLDQKEDLLENEIVYHFCTPAFIEKEYAKIINDNPNIERRKLIPMLLQIVWHTFIDEEMFNILKKHKNAKIDFRILQNLVVKKVKEVKVDLFS